MVCDVDVTLRGVAVDEETIYFVRRCVRRLVAELAWRDARVSVCLERRKASREVQAVASIVTGTGKCEGHGEDLDELLATSNAFARLRETLLAESRLLVSVA